ncbi:WD repeat-containing protein, putative [Hepatocystis sp. ex Piliocolobus tephrosceles]|nr:WD repeat-containing protein, putative [Hepatocystis sp. ex Piliocolobus tephrosceles]
MKKRKLSTSFNSSSPSKITEIEENETENIYIYPKITHCPILINGDKIIYGYGNKLILFNLKEKRFIKNIEHHKNIIRSLDIDKSNNYFLTTGDDKIIIIYNKNWEVLKKIVHKKKIFKAYFYKYVENDNIEKKNKFEIIFIDKYSDLYICDIMPLLSKKDNMNKSSYINGINKSCAIENGENCAIENGENCAIENGENCAIENGENCAISTDINECVSFDYLYDALNEVEEKDEDIFFLKDIENTLNKKNKENSKKCNINNSSDIDSNKKDDYKDESSNKQDNTNLTDLGYAKDIDRIKTELENHYCKCFENEKYIYPILTCNSAIVCLYYNNDYLIIGDRDEKIRLIKNKKINEIYNFYLHHKLFITSLVLISNNIFCSTAADSYLYIWNIKNQQIIDSIYLNFEFLSQYINFESTSTNIINISDNTTDINKYKFIISLLLFNNNTNCIYAVIENIKGILIIPLIINSECDSNVIIDKMRITFFTLNHYVLSYLFINYNNTNILIYVDREKGNLHQLELNEQGMLNKNITTFEHFFFDTSVHGKFVYMTQWYID